ncbi:MAG: ROK family protein [Gemmatimonadales bacterium]
MTKRYITGVDLGGTNIVVGTVRVDGSEIVGFSKRVTPVAEGPDAIIQQILEQVRESVATTSAERPDSEVLGIGVGSPGPLDRQTGEVLFTPNLGWRNVPLRDSVRRAIGLPTTLDNDANCAVLGETWMGAARGANFVVGLTIGTGIGGGIVLNGMTYHGVADVAGEFGHMTIDSTGRRCGCGNYGCLEAYAAAPAIARRAIESLDTNTPSLLRELVGGNVGLITSETVYQAAAQGDELALEVVRDTARFLGTGIANLVNVLNPEVFVICGGVTAAGDALFVPLREEVRRRAFRPAVESCRIVAGELTGTAGVYGAVAAFEHQRNTAE